MTGFISALLQYKYLALFLVGSVEGFNTFLVAGFLVSTGALDLVPAALAAFAAEMINSFFWYVVGYWGGAKPLEFFLKKSPVKRKFLENIRKNFYDYAGIMLILVKVTWSVTIVTLITAGSLKYPLKKFALYNLIGSVLWVGITFSFGYFLGAGYQLYVEYFRNISYLIVLGLVTVIVIYLIGRISRKVLVHMFSFADGLHNVGEKIIGEFERKFPNHDDSKR